MADTAPFLLPDESILASRARAAGVDLEGLPLLLRLERLRAFRTQEEDDALKARARAEIAEDAHKFNEVFAKEGFWFEGWRQW